jgi:hypothetical protein
MKEIATASEGCLAMTSLLKGKLPRRAAVRNDLIHNYTLGKSE